MNKKYLSGLFVLVFVCLGGYRALAAGENYGQGHACNTSGQCAAGLFCAGATTSSTDTTCQPALAFSEVINDASRIVNNPESTVATMRDIILQLLFLQKKDTATGTSPDAIFKVTGLGSNIAKLTLNGTVLASDKYTVKRDGNVSIFSIRPESLADGENIFHAVGVNPKGESVTGSVTVTATKLSGNVLMPRSAAVTPAAEEIRAAAIGETVDAAVTENFLNRLFSLFMSKERRTANLRDRIEANRAGAATTVTTPPATGGTNQPTLIPGSVISGQRISSFADFSSKLGNDKEALLGLQNLFGIQQTGLFDSSTRNLLLKAQTINADGSLSFNIAKVLSSERINTLLSIFNNAKKDGTLVQIQPGGSGFNTRNFFINTGNSGPANIYIVRNFHPPYTGWLICEAGWCTDFN